MKSLLVVLAMLVSANSAAQTWPAKPLRLIFPFAAGGSGDSLARFLGAKMAADLGQPVLVANTSRSPVLPDVPTTIEAGYKSVLVTTWYGLMAPARTPPELVTRANASLNKALQHPETAAYFKAQGVDAVGGTAADFGAFIRAESVKWGTLAKAAGVKLE